ncbi:hypothetical protein [Archangium lansingense]|uniref:DUF2171 domain-containing protein n=1 Tax=Archangium lansingense TaxID=2995310 RepID=A0ABT3ZX07_9BACT|nr:hypothetical protein [Archangium lansinium]MCY1073923.1 hypothetical protein [Archangium lansinium]
MSQRKIQAGMVVRSHDGEPLGRVISVDDECFVLERRVVVTREHRVSLEDVKSLDEHGIVLGPEHGHPRARLEATDLVEVFWSSKRARDEQRPLEEREEPDTLASHEMVAAAEHAEAYPIHVERGTVPHPRYVPMSEEEPRRSGGAPEESWDSDTRHASRDDPPSKHGMRETVIHYATHPIEAASELLGLLRGERTHPRH